jgi:hypothetical protein
VAIPTGTRLGPYEVVGLLGTGGMGEVYRARHPELQREVALKILPDAGADRARADRLRREAQLLASLNHPNIGAIYDVIDSAAGPVLVLELVEGRTLKEVIEGPTRPALPGILAIARQIADALESAHERGIVHRDLKPANIKIRTDGSIKVLDFGIAKALRPDRSEAMSNDLPTATATQPGAVLGTAAYMSPEQARGEPATRQADVWAFGAILFELLAGQRPFAGATRSDVLAAVLRAVPDWSALPEDTPPSVRRLVRRCLERDPKARLRDVGDARLEITDAEQALSSTSGATPALRETAARSRSTARRLVPALAVLIGLAGIALAYYLGTQRQPAADELRLQMAPPPGTHFVSVPALSPDGRQIVFVAVGDAGGASSLWLRPLAASESRRLAGTEGAIYPFWSRDNRTVAFFADGRLRRLDVSGGGPIDICEAAAGRGGLWLDDDSIVFAPTQFAPLMRVPAAGGRPVAFTTLAAEETGHRFPQRLPGRQLLYYVVNKEGTLNGTRLASIDDPNRAIAFARGAGTAEYVRGFLMSIRGSAIVAQAIALPSGQVSGDPIHVGHTRISETYGRFVATTSPAGVIAYLGPLDAVGQLTWINRDGRTLDTIGGPEVQSGVELSPDGQRLATLRSGGIWTLDVGRPVPSQAMRGRHPFWSADGKQIVSLGPSLTVGFVLQIADLGVGAVRTLSSSSEFMKPLAWTRDGNLVINRTAHKTTARELWIVPVDKPEQATPYLQDGAQNHEARLSPDGKWLAYSSDRSRRFEVEVRSYPVPGAPYPVSVDGGGYPRWRADGRELYFLSPRSELMAVPVTPGNPPVFGTPRLLFEVKLVAHPDRGNFAEYEYDVTADGARFLVNRMISEPATSMTIITNWRQRQ